MKYVVDIVPPKYLEAEAKGETVYYVHMDGFPHIPVFGSFGSKQKANKICRMYNIEGRKKWQSTMN